MQLDPKRMGGPCVECERCGACHYGPTHYKKTSDGAIHWYCDSCVHVAEEPNDVGL